MERNNIKDFYAQEVEANRLELELFKLEGIRTKEIIERYLQAGNLEVLDLGGGTGYYSFWLQGKGHNVTLVDLSPANIELARKHATATGTALKEMETGDAVRLGFSENQFDLVLMLGPLYHLIDRTERIRALSEAKKVLKPQGILLAAVISRYASLIDGFHRDLVFDKQFMNILLDDLKTGLHLNKTGNPEYFTTAYFHTAKEIEEEIVECGLQFEKLIPVESFGWIVQHFSEKEKDPEYMKNLLNIIRMVEMNGDLMAISPHLIAVSRKE